MDKYSVSKVKVFMGREGHGFNATLLRNDKPVAEVIDDASGGETRFAWLDRVRAAGLIDFPAVNYKDEPITVRGTPEEGAFWAHCIALGTYESYGVKMAHTPDGVVETLVFDEDRRKRKSARLKRAMKTQLLFIRDGVEYFCKPTKAGVDPLTLVEGVKQRYPTATILNTLPFDEALALVIGLAS